MPDPIDHLVPWWSQLVLFHAEESDERDDYRVQACVRRIAQALGQHGVADDAAAHAVALHEAALARIGDAVPELRARRLRTTSRGLLASLVARLDTCGATCGQEQGSGS